VCTGAKPAFEQAFASVNKKGTILLFAIPDTNIVLPTVDVWRNEITVTSSYGAAPRDLDEALALIADKKIDVARLISHRFPLTDIQQAFDLVANPKESLKVVIVQ